MTHYAANRPHFRTSSGSPVWLFRDFEASVFQDIGKPGKRESHLISLPLWRLAASTSLVGSTALKSTSQPSTDFIIIAVVCIYRCLNPTEGRRQLVVLSGLTFFNFEVAATNVEILAIACSLVIT